MYRTATFTLLIALGLLGCDGVSEQKIASEDFFFEQPIVNQTGLVLEAINGNITIMGVAGADVVTVEGTREVQAKTVDEAQQGLAELQVDVEAFAEEIVVRTVQPEGNDDRNFVVNYEISLPANLVVVVATANGNIDAINIDSSVSVQLVNGSVEARVTLPPGGFVDITIGNGETDLFIPVNTSAMFSAVVANGSIDTANLELQNLVTTNRTVTGVLGEGNGAITLQTGNGRITASGF